MIYLITTFWLSFDKYKDVRLKSGNVNDNVTAQRLGSPFKSIGYHFLHLDLAAPQFTPGLKNNLSGCCFFYGRIY